MINFGDYGKTRHPKMVGVMCALIGLGVIFSIGASPDRSQESEIRRLKAENKLLRSTIRNQAEQIARLKRDHAKQIKNLKKDHAKQIKLLKAELAKLKSRTKTDDKQAATQPTTAPAKIPQEWITSFRIAEAHSKRQSARGAANPEPSLPNLTDLDIGYAGSLTDGLTRVFQVIDKRQMLAHILQGYSIRSRRPIWKELALFRGIDTSKYADGSTAHLSGWFIVTGTHRYNTASGASRTAFVVEPLDRQRWLAAYEHWRNQKKDPRQKVEKVENAAPGHDK